MNRVRKLLIPTVLLITAFPGCMSGTIGVQNTATSQSPNGTEQANSGKGKSRVGPSPGATLSDAEAASKTLFFSVSRDMLAGVVSGFGFLSTQAQFQTPFTYYFNAAVGKSIPYFRPVFLDGMEQIAWIEVDSTGARMKTLSPSSIIATDHGVLEPSLSWAISFDATEIAEISEDGTLAIQTLDPDNIAQPVSPPIKTASLGLTSTTTLTWLNSTNDIAILATEKSILQIYSAKDLGQASFSTQAESYSVSPSGNLVLALENDGLKLFDRKNHTNDRPIDLNIQTFIHPSWRDESTLAFIDSSESKVQIDVLDLQSGRLSAQYPLVMQTANASMACPIWISSQLYFSDLKGDAWAIWRANPNNIQSPTPFVLPSDSEQGFFCPQGVIE